MNKQLNQNEKREIKQATTSLMTQDAHHSARGGSKTFMPNVVLSKNCISPEFWKSLSKMAKEHCISISLQAEILCSCPERGPSRYQKDQMRKMIQMKKDTTEAKALGAVSWSNSMAMSPSSTLLDYSRTDRVHGPSRMQTLSPEDLSKLVFCFQHYAYNSTLNRPQVAPSYPALTTTGPDIAGRNGVLDANTRAMLEYLWESNFTKVSSSAQPLSTMGKLFASTIMANTSWPALVEKIARQYPPQELVDSEKFVAVRSKNHPYSQVFFMPSDVGTSADQNPLVFIGRNLSNLPSGSVKSLISQLQNENNDALNIQRLSSNVSTSMSQNTPAAQAKEQYNRSMQQQTAMRNIPR